VVHVVIDRTLCQGHGLCVGEAPDVFDLADTGELVVLNATPSEAQRPALDAAAIGCPTGAISIHDE
jgi:ferredoxin